MVEYLLPFGLGSGGTVLSCEALRSLVERCFELVGICLEVRGMTGSKYCKEDSFAPRGASLAVSRPCEIINKNFFYLEVRS